MKKLLFTAYTLDLGGIETALVTLLNELVNKYDVTLVLEKKQGIFLDELSSKVKIIEYTPSSSKNIIIRKMQNFIKQIKFVMKYKNKYDFSASFATYSGPGSFCARTASKNSALWAHTDYLTMFDNEKEEVIKFFEFVKYNKFKKIIFVSESAKESFIKVFPEMQDKTFKCNNMINYKKIIEKSTEKIEINKDEIFTFLNVSRHEEKSKKITRLLEVAKRLKAEGKIFRILLVGDGEDTEKYKEIVINNKLEDVICFLGAKKNPYPYFNIADSIVLTSEYEGYPVIVIEALTLNKPIIVTDVSDMKKDLDGKYGIVVEKNVESLYSAMKKMLTNKYEIEKKFSPKEFNRNILEFIERIILKRRSYMQKISVIVPVYNGEKYIEKCLNSILKQKHENIEIVIVNNGSIDESDKKIQEFLKKYNNIKYLNFDKKIGLSAARNIGEREASGQYICFLDVDDYLEENLFEILTKKINLNIDLIKYKLIVVNGEKEEKVEGPVFDIKTGEEAFAELYKTDVMMESACIYLIKKSFYDENNFKFEENTFHEDFGLMPLVIVTANSVISMPIYGYYYVQSGESITRGNDYEKTKKRAYDVLKHYDNMVKKIQGNNLVEGTKEKIRNYYINAAINKVTELEKSEQKKYIIEIKKRKMIKLLKTYNIKQLIKKIILKINVDLYLRLK